MRGWPYHRAPTPTNTFGLNQNCYYCVVAALLETNTDELVKRTETMQQDCATAEQIDDLMKAAGMNPKVTTYHDLQSIRQDLATLPFGQQVGLAYVRNDGTGHMIVAVRDGTGDAGFYDPQQANMVFTRDFPENLATVHEITIFSQQ